MKSNVKILLLGGGFTLNFLASKLDPNSFVVTSRDLNKIAEWRRLGYFAEFLDLNKPESLEALFSNFALIKMMVDSTTPNWTSVNSAQKDIAAICDILIAKKLERIVYLSTTGVFGKEDGSWVDEKTECHPKYESSKLRLAVERGYQEADLAITILRLPAIYGSDHQGLSRGLFEALKIGRFRIIEEGNRWSNRIHVWDLTEIIKIILTKNIALKDLYCLADDEPAIQMDVVKYYCGILSIPLPESISIKEAQEKGMHTLLSNQRISNSLVKEDLGYKFAYPSYKLLTC